MKKPEQKRKKDIKQNKRYYLKIKMKVGFNLCQINLIIAVNALKENLKRKITR